MGIRSLHSAFNHIAVGRMASLGHSLPLPTPLTVIGNFYVDSDTPSEYATFWAMGPESFSGTDYFTFATVASTPASDLSAGMDGHDHVAAQVVTGRWYRQAAVMWRDGTDTYLDYYYDLPNLAAVVHANGANSSGANPTYFSATSGTTFFRFLDVAWASNETLDGRGCGFKCFQAALPGGACALESMSAYPVLPQYRPALWGCWPVPNVANLLDISGNGRHLFLTGTTPTSIADNGLIRRPLDYRLGSQELLITPAVAGGGGGGTTNGGRRALLGVGI